MPSEWERLIRKTIEKLMPDFSGYMKPPIKGTVRRVYGAGGGYACDVQPMNNDESKSDEPVLTQVEIPSILGGDGWGLLCLPKIDQRVMVGFYRGDPDEPFIIGMRSKGQSTPAVGANEVLLQHSGDVRVEAGGKLIANVAGDADVTAANVNVTAGLTKVNGDFEVTGNADVGGALAATGAVSSEMGLSDPNGDMQSIRDTYDTHTHNENDNAPAATGVPNQGM